MNLSKNIAIVFNLDEISDSLDESIKFLLENKIKFVEIRKINTKNITNLSLKETHALKQKLDFYSLSTIAIASPLFKWHSKIVHSHKDVDLFGGNPYLSKEEKIELIDKVISQAVILGAKIVRVFSGLISPSGLIPIDEIDLLKYALSISNKKGIKLLLENEPVCNISSIEDYTNFFLSKKLKGLRSWFDIANIYEEGGKITTKNLKKILPFVDYIHIKDPVGIRMHEYTPVGKGFINYKKIITDIKSFVNKKIYLSIETHTKYNKMAASLESLNYLREILLTTRIKYGIVGAGKISKKHFWAIRSNHNSELRGVFDIKLSVATNASILQDCELFNSFEQLVKNNLIDVVVICTPHDTHLKLASFAIKHGKKVLCEKPLAIKAILIKDYIKNVNQKENTFIVFQNRFNCSMKKLYHHIDKSLGQIKYVNITLRWWRDSSYYNSSHGKKYRSGGALITQAIHSIDILINILNAGEVKNISIRSKKTRKPITLPDIIIALIEFENGIFSTIEICVATDKKNTESSIFIVGENSSIKIGGVTLSQVEYINGDKVKDLDYDSRDHYGKRHIKIYKTLSDCFLNKTNQMPPLIARPQDAINVLTFIEKIEKAISDSKKN